MDLKHIPSDKTVLDLVSVAEMESGVLEFKGWDGGKAWQNADYILARFGDAKKGARKRYSSFVEEVIGVIYD